MTEQLTDEERFWIQRFHGCSHIDKALRLLDAHAADRAALEAQLDAAADVMNRWLKHYDPEGKHGFTHDIRHFKATALGQLERLKSEPVVMAGYTWCKLERAAKAESEVTRLTKALVAAERNRAQYMAEAESECAALRDTNAMQYGQLQQSRAEVERLRAKIARVELDAISAESRLAAAIALLGRCQQAVSAASLLGRDLDAHLAAQPATAPQPGDTRVVFGSFEPRQLVSAAEFAQPATAPARTEGKRGCVHFDHMRGMVCDECRGLKR